MLVFAANLLEAAVAGLEPLVAIDLLAAGDHLSLVDSWARYYVIDCLLKFMSVMSAYFEVIFVEFNSCRAQEIPRDGDDRSL